MIRTTREYKVEHDLIKSLPPGCCVLHVSGKSKNNLDLVKLWNKDSKSLQAWKFDYNRLWDEYKDQSFCSLPSIESVLTSS